MRNTRASRTMPTEKQYLYYLIVSQLYNDGHTEAAIQLEMTALQSTGCVKAGDRLNKMLSACVGGFTDVTDFLDEQKSATHKSYTTPPPSSSRKRPLPSSTSDTISSSSVASNILHANTDPNTSPTINVYKCVKLLTNTDLISNDMLSPTTPETASSEAITEPNPPEIPIQDINTDTHIAIGLNDPKEYPKNINLTNPLQSPILDPELIQNIDTTNISNFSNLTKDLEDICKAVADELPLPVNYAELIKPAPEETTVKDEAEVSIKTEQIDPPDLEDSNATLNNLTACIMGSLAQYQDTPGPSVDYTNYIENQKSGMDMLMGYKDGSPISSSSPASLNTTDVMVPVSGEHSNSEASLSSDAPRKTKTTRRSLTCTPLSKPVPRTSKSIPFKLKLECVKYGLNNWCDWSKTAELFNKRYPKFVFKPEVITHWSEKVKVHVKKMRDKDYFSINTASSSNSRKSDNLNCENGENGNNLSSGKIEKLSSFKKDDNLKSGTAGFNTWDHAVRCVVNTPSGSGKVSCNEVLALTCPEEDNPLIIVEDINVESCKPLTIPLTDDSVRVEGSAVNAQREVVIQDGLPTLLPIQNEVILSYPLEPGVVPIVSSLGSSDNITLSPSVKEIKKTALNIPLEKRNVFKAHVLEKSRVKKTRKNIKTADKKKKKKKQDSEKESGLHQINLCHLTANKV